MKLYGSPTSPYVRKVRAFMKERNIDCEFVVEGPHDEAGNVARLNPLGKVPLIVRDDGEVLFDSPMLIEYLDSLRDEALYPPPSEARWQVQRWRALGQGLCDATVARLMETRRVPERQDPAVIARQEDKVAGALRFADERVSGGNYLFGERFGIADIAMAVALEYVDFRYAHDWRSQYKRLAHWLSGIADQHSLKETRFPA